MLDFIQQTTQPTLQTHTFIEMQLKSRMERSIVFVTHEGHATV